jgi:hypothetical protein
MAVDRKTAKHSLSIPLPVDPHTIRGPLRTPIR